MPRSPSSPAEGARPRRPAPTTHPYTHPALSPARLRGFRGFLPESDVQSPERRHTTGASLVLGMGGESGDRSDTGERLPGRVESRGGLMQEGARSISPCLHIRLALVEIWTRNAADQ